MLEKTLEKLKDFWGRVGWHRETYLRNLMPKDKDGMLRWMLDHQQGILTFPPAPCPWLCNRKLKRFHLTCLTCWNRRLHFKKWGWKKLRWYRKVHMANKHPIKNKGAVPILTLDVMPGGKVALPLYYTNYGIFVPTSREGAVNRFRLWIVKYLLTLAERVAEW